MTQERQWYTLQTIFSFFLGLIIAAFVGVGVNTFYPSPRTVFEDQLQELRRQQEDIQRSAGKDGMLAPEDQTKMSAVVEQQRALQDKVEGKERIWARNTSIVVILFATAVMALSLTLSGQLKVISNGLLLGGLFSMVYGIGWVIASGESTARFVVMVFALAVTILLGYLRFVRRRTLAPPAARGPMPPSAPELAGLAARIDALEASVAAAAAALSAPVAGSREE